MSAERATGEAAPAADRTGRPAVPRWQRSKVAAAARFVLQRGALRPLVRSLVRLETVGDVPARGPYVVVANHSSHLDTALLVTHLPRRLVRRLAVGAAADYFFASRRRSLVTGLVFSTFPVDRGKERPKRGLSGRLLDAGFSLLVFPEGTRSRDGLMGDFRPGAAALCVAKGVPCLPVGITGAYDAMPRGRSWPRPGRPPVRVVFGAPLTPRPGEPVAVFADRMHAAVAALHQQGVRNAG
ncbi:1-acyl-sn-glycerol-3-phosphate acyltransferase [Kribbella sandramycini]|uniref:1-acyl-sn-glycerol-3-phosphate acyltransferase n=1 Tax=Kribbella sandramycini TaxID=60450 RepID=A0A7Y4NYZ6_9ACTN|nr:lysophospholipid acyltransferase family protein [Kribbella sandramycini]MBB6569852.1 1-acyl-sn-glycerol-3-phosphate acyltransferase [Kribbella sandramycini]NOL40323.1 1-acyl-sn-glycerol-3-phosphate acyltransferase [Kribbella sandramycini]